MKNLDLIEQRAWTAPFWERNLAVRDFPSMLSNEEKWMLNFIVARCFENAGCICELGSFLGGSTIALADGLRQAGIRDRKIHSYDRHQINKPLWDKYQLDSLDLDMPKDGDFFPLMETLLGTENFDLIKFYSGDFLTQPTPDEKIEILFVDLAKVSATWDKVVEDYLSRLIPGKSIVIQQDYLHAWPVLDVVGMEILKDNFECISYTELNSVIFFYKKEISKEQLEAAKSNNVRNTDIIQNLRRAAQNFPHARQRWSIFEIEHLYRVNGPTVFDMQEHTAKVAASRTAKDISVFEKSYL